MMTSSLPPRTLRPLLKLSPSDVIASEVFSASQLKAQGFGGVVLDANQIASGDRESFYGFRAEAAKQNLEVWLDITNLSSGGSAELNRWQLNFDGDQPRSHKSNDNLLDPFSKDSAQHVILLLEQLQADVFTGVLGEVRWHESENPETEFPPFPWSPLLAEKFSMEQMTALVSNTGVEAARIRQQYWQELAQLVADNFINPLADWCRTKNLDCNLHVFHPEYEVLELDETLRTRLSSSTAPTHHVLISGETPADMLGSFYRQLHAGARRFVVEYSDFSLTRTGQLLNEAVHRSVQLLCETTNLARVGVLFPARSCRTHYHPQGHRFTRWVADDLKYITDLLDNLHFDWIFISEEDVAAGQLDGSTLITPRSQLIEMVLLPSVTALGTGTWSTLMKFIESSGKVACLGLLPRWSENGRDRSFEEQVGKTARLVIDDLFAAYTAQEDEEPLPPTIGFPVFREYSSGGRLCTYQPLLNSDRDDARLRVHQILRESILPDLETQSTQVKFSHAARSSDEIFFVFNDGGLAQRANLRVRLQHQIAPEMTELISIQPVTGDGDRIFVWMPHPIEQGGGLSFSLCLAPDEARFISIQPSFGENIPRIESATFEVVEFDGKVLHGFATESGAHTAALRRNGKVEWHESKPVHIPQPILLDDWNESTPASPSGGTSVVLEIMIPSTWKECCIFLEIAGVQDFCRATVNGTSVGESIVPPWRFDITDCLHTGAANRISIEADKSTDPEVMIARLVAYPVISIETGKESDNE